MAFVFCLVFSRVFEFGSPPKTQGWGHWFLIPKGGGRMTGDPPELLTVPGLHWTKGTWNLTPADLWGMWKPGMGLGEL